MPVHPQGPLRRSFVYRALLAEGAQFEMVGDTAVAMRFAAVGEEAAAARRLGLCDLSPLPRIGFKGRDLAAWLDEQGLAVGADSNRAYPLPGGLALRLAPGEVIILGDLGGLGTLPERLAAAWRMSDRLCFPVPRRDGSLWFMLTGAAVPATFAKLCGVDLRLDRFPDHAIAQTSLARMNAILCRDDQGGVPAFHVIADSASADFLRGCLLDAMAEFDGRPIGLTALRGLAEARP